MPLSDRRRIRRAVMIAVAARVVIVIAAAAAAGGPDAFYLPDSRQYARLAAALVHDGAYAVDGRPEIFRPPGYPALVAVGTALGAPTAITLGLQVAMGLVTLLLCVDLGRSAGGARAGAVAGLLYACEPGQWIHGAFVLSETLFTACVALALAAAARFLVTSRRRWIVVAATAAAASAYVRPVGYLLVPVVLGAVLWAGRRPAGPTARGRAAGGHAARTEPAGAHAPGTTRVDWRAYGAAALTAVVLLGPWHMRNGMETGYWGFSVQFERAAYFMGGASALAREGAAPVEARRALDDRLRAVGDAGDAGTRATFMWTDAARRILANPVGFAATYGSGVAAVLLHPGSGAAFRLFGRGDPAADWSDSATRLIVYGRWADAWTALARKGAAYWAVTVVLGASAVFYLGLAIAGAWRARAGPATRLIAVVALALICVSGGPDADARRRVPITPAFCVLGALALAGPIRGGARGPARSDAPVARG